PLQIKPIDLPPGSVYPGLKAFVQQEEIARRKSALDAAEASVKKITAEVAKDAELGKLAIAAAEAQRTAAQSDLRSIQMRIAADEARFNGGAGDPDRLARLASKAERQAKLEAARVVRAKKQHELAVARAKPK